MNDLEELGLLESLELVYRDTLIPELMQELGYDNFISFISIFGGKWVYIPSLSDIAVISRNSRIYRELKPLEGSQSEFNKRVWTLSASCDLTLDQIREIHANGGKFWDHLKSLGLRSLNLNLVGDPVKLERSMSFNPKIHTRYKRIA